MFGCYIICIESLVEVDRLGVTVEGPSVRLGKIEFKIIDRNSKRSTDKSLAGDHVATN
jgi:hypothetical protein